MNKQSRVANRLAWGERLERFKQSDQTVAPGAVAPGARTRCQPPHPVPATN